MVLRRAADRAKLAGIASHAASPQTMPRRILPIGIQTFREIRESDC